MNFSCIHLIAKFISFFMSTIPQCICTTFYDTAIHCWEFILRTEMKLACERVICNHIFTEAQITKDVESTQISNYRRLDEIFPYFYWCGFVVYVCVFALEIKCYFFIPFFLRGFTLALDLPYPLYFVLLPLCCSFPFWFLWWPTVHYWHVF